MDSVDTKSLLYATSDNCIYVLGTKSHDKLHMEDLHRWTRKCKQYINLGSY